MFLRAAYLRAAYIRGACVRAALVLVMGSPLLGPALRAEGSPELEMIRLTRDEPDSPKLREALIAHLGREKLSEGTAVSHGPDFLFAIDAAHYPVLLVNDQPLGAMTRLGGSDLWVYPTRLETGRSHAFSFVIQGEAGKRNDLPAYGPDSYPQPGVPQGTVSEKLVHQSEIYPGMRSDYWVYVSPGYDPRGGAAVMFWQDGNRFAERGSPSRLFTVTENLVHQKKIPPMIHILVAPGFAGEERMRSFEYDPVSDTYARFLLEEILPEVEKKYRIRKDAYSRGIAGQSSGGICAFNAAWQRPDQFARVLSRIGSYTAIAWRSADAGARDVFEGGHFFPSKIRKEDKRNIRVWLEDGSEDLENVHGSWPLQNIQMANSLKMREYDFHFSFGNAQHNTTHGDAELPQALTWLWRGYDPSRSEQTYEMDPAEKQKPYFRVRIYNRD